MLISVVIPVYNYEGVVGRAIQSALNQDYSEVEVVVVDDGSTDRTALVALSFGDRVRLIQQPNAGLAAARNAGMIHAAGQWVFFLDADDFMAPNALTVLHEALGSQDNSCALAACNPNILYEPVDVEVALTTETRREGQTAEIQWRQLVMGSQFPCTVLARKQPLLDLGGFDPDFKRDGCEDRDMWLRVAARYRIIRVPDCLVYIVGHGNNMSYNPEPQLRGRARCLRKARQAGVVSAWNLPFWGRAYSAHYAAGSLLYSGKGLHGTAFFEALKALLVYPFPGASVASNRAAFTRARRILVEGWRVIQSLI